MDEHCKGQSNIEAARDAAQQKRDNMPGQQMTESEAEVEAIRGSRWDELAERCGPSPEESIERTVDEIDKVYTSEPLDFKKIGDILAKFREAATAKLREESKQFKDIISRSILDPADEEIVNALLAHQQPSADFRQPDETRYPGYGSDFRAKPSAPTADVEWRLVKGVPNSDGDSWDIYEGDRRIAFDLMNEEAGPIVALHNTALAQARAPLVAALEEAERRAGIWMRLYHRETALTRTKIS